MRDHCAARWADGPEKDDCLEQIDGEIALRRARSEHARDGGTAQGERE